MASFYKEGAVFVTNAGMNIPETRVITSNSRVEEEVLATESGSIHPKGLRALSIFSPLLSTSRQTGGEEEADEMRGGTALVDLQDLGIRMEAGKDFQTRKPRVSVFPHRTDFPH